MNCAVVGLSKYIPPIPSELASIPIPSNIKSIGITNRLDFLPAKRDKKRRIAPISSIFSDVIFIIPKNSAIQTRIQQKYIGKFLFLNHA